jgi:hypothetical protein
MSREAVPLGQYRLQEAGGYSHTVK